MHLLGSPRAATSAGAPASVTACKAANTAKNRGSPIPGIHGIGGSRDFPEISRLPPMPLMLSLPGALAAPSKSSQPVARTASPCARQMPSLQGPPLFTTRAVETARARRGEPGAAVPWVCRQTRGALQPVHPAGCRPLGSARCPSGRG